MAERNSNVQLLAVSADWGDVEDSEYRFLVDGKDVKYVTTAPGIFPKDDRTFAPILIPLLPQFPPGDWNEGHVTKNDITGELEFARATTAILPGVENNWHPVKVGHLELVKLERFHQNIDKVTHPRFSHPVVVKFAEFPWKIPQIELETTAYQHIDGSGIGPNFPGTCHRGGQDNRLFDRLRGGFTHRCGERRPSWLSTYSGKTAWTGL
ncbi:hypothetical protein BU24DRAFT_419550 [Aaosphaeria arxii CBS 175.79]|uniref:Uncharacterized protein n=1 Tax=Aaosphaeria arxii CBS 175.79 TaxID=1450172 RepID=A0A6A5Y425_9PLEO|nr:uncharacterized protein BU24DRAFT_419550 [Aaosphaeria arxii CBS 175.79]KAF2019943.1 hypothetical protein BU24DRAFT_419550 [Aaosphaeria arxii CBS 175.79]